VIKNERKLSQNVRDRREIFKIYESTGFLAGAVEYKRCRTVA
jgi:hypothetical protein